MREYTCWCYGECKVPEAKVEIYAKAPATYVGGGSGKKNIEDARKKYQEVKSFIFENIYSYGTINRTIEECLEFEKDMLRFFRNVSRWFRIPDFRGDNQKYEQYKDG